MRRTVTIISSIFVLWSSFIYAVDKNENPKHKELQGAFEGQNIENLEAAEAVFLKGPDMTPNAVQREDLPGIRFWSIDDYINASPKNKHNALLNMGSYNRKAIQLEQRGTIIVGEGDVNSETRTAPINTWTKEQYLNITPSERHNAINNMQKEPLVAPGGETKVEQRTKAIRDYSQEELLNITPEHKQKALASASRSFRVGGRSHNNTTINLDPDSWYSEASWNVYDSTAGAYYYSANQTFSSSAAVAVTLNLLPGSYSVDVWDSYGDGGTAGSVTDDNETELVSWASSSYTTFGQFGFDVTPPQFEATVSLAPDSWYSEASWNVYDSTAGAYYYSANQTFTSSAAVSVVLSLAGGVHSVDIWDSYGDGGTAGSVASASGDVLVSWTSSSYTTFGQFGFEVLVPLNAPDLFFSEYIEGSSNNKALEVYNPTDETLSLDNYIIYTNYNGNSWSPGDGGRYTFPSGATVLPGEVFVAASADAWDEVLQAADSAYAYGDGAYITSFNGDDARGLAKIHDGDTTIIDLIGFYDIEADTSVDPGSGWDVAGVSAATANHTLIRKTDVMWGNTDWTASAGTDSATSEWRVYDQNYFTNLGGHPDDPCWENGIHISVSSVSWGSEISYMLTNADGDTLASCFGCMANNQTNAHDLCLPDGAFSFWGKDSYGDGWNGGSFTVTKDDGSVIIAGAVESTDGTSWVEFPFATNNYISGLVTDSETGAALDSVAVNISGSVVYTDAAGSYALKGFAIYPFVINFSKTGYLNASFYIAGVAAGDSSSQNAVLVAQSSASQEVYSTGFEPGEDTGWTATGGANPFEVSGGFTFETLTVAPFAGDSMMVCSPTGYAESEFSWWMNLTNSDMDLSGFLGAELTLQMNYWTEAGYDNILLLATMPEIYGTLYYYLDVNGDGVGNASDAISGSSDGWVEVTADLSPWTGTSYGVEVAVLLMADATVNEGFGVAIDDVTVNGFNEPRPGVTDLTAESFVDDQVHLMWSDPTGGERTQSTQTITTDRTAIEVSPRNPRKAFEYEINDAEIEYTIPARTDRDLVSYNVFRTDQYSFADYSGFDLIANTTDPA